MNFLWGAAKGCNLHTEPLPYKTKGNCYKNLINLSVFDICISAFYLFKMHRNDTALFMFRHKYIRLCVLYLSEMIFSAVPFLNKNLFNMSIFNLNVNVTGEILSFDYKMQFLNN